MFTQDFYPTPANVIEMMAAGLDLHGMTALEPSAGKGDIIDYLKSRGASVVACELHPDLASIAMKKASFLKRDFFQVTSEEVSHIDYIIMNPPFSNADKHIKHAWDIAPSGCHIVALCNISTVKNRSYKLREELGEIIDKNGGWENIGDAFSTAERTTYVDVALVNLYKPRNGESEFADYFFDMTEEQEDVINGSGITKHDEIREIVNRYVGAVKMFDSVMDASRSINGLIAPISSGLGISFGAHSNDRHISSNMSRDDFKKALQKSAWKSVFDKMNMAKYVTGSVMSDINKFVERQQQIPFTMTNIYKMIEVIVGTHSGRMDRVLVEVFDRICSLSADNSEAGEKWKTNSSYKINRRFINTWVCEYDSRWPKAHVDVRYNASDGLINDVVKALCHITGRSYDEVMRPDYKVEYSGIQNSLATFFRYNHTPWGEWVDWNELFRVRGYKKGTMHFEFRDEEVWLEFNRRVAKIKGWAIPHKTDKKTRGTERAKTSGVEVFENNLF